MTSRLLARSAHARLRLRANDGFNDAAVTSAMFRAAGGPPATAILSPRPGQRIASDAALYLSGEADDDAGRRLSGRRLRWFVGHRRVGTGAELSPSGLPAGRIRVRLLATDGHGRTGTAAVTLHVNAVAPQFVVLRAPPQLSPLARYVRLVVESTVPATLVVKGRGLHAHVGRRPRALKVRIKPAATPLSLNLVLQAAGHRTAVPVSVVR